MGRWITSTHLDWQHIRNQMKYNITVGILNVTYCCNPHFQVYTSQEIGACVVDVIELISLIRNSSAALCLVPRKTDKYTPKNMAFCKNILSIFSSYNTGPFRYEVWYQQVVWNIEWWNLLISCFLVVCAFCSICYRYLRKLKSITIVLSCQNSHSVVELTMLISLNRNTHDVVFVFNKLIAIIIWTSNHIHCLSEMSLPIHVLNSTVVSLSLKLWHGWIITFHPCMYM